MNGKIFLIASLSLAAAGFCGAQGTIQSPQERYLFSGPEIKTVDPLSLKYDGQYDYSDIVTAGGIYTSDCQAVLEDQATETQYLALTDEFTASPFSAVIFRKEEPVGRAFIRNEDGTYNFLICESDPSIINKQLGHTTVYMRRDLWEHYYSDQLQNLTLRKGFNSLVLSFTSDGVKRERERNLIVYRDLKKGFVETTINEFVHIRQLSQTKTAADIKSYLNDSFTDRPSQSPEEFLKDAILVNGMYYAPYGDLKQDDIFDNSGSFIGHPFTPVKIAGKVIEKFILIGQQPYLALPWWASEIFDDSRYIFDFDNWRAYQRLDWESWPKAVDQYAIAITPPASPLTYQMETLRATWVTRVTAPTRERWANYLDGAICVNGLPMVKADNLSSEYSLSVNGNRIMQDQQTIATVFDPAVKTPAVRLNGEVYVPVTFLTGVQYDQPSDTLTAPHNDDLRATINLRPLGLKTYALSELIRQDKQQADQAQQAAEQRARAAQQQALATQKAQQQAAAAAQAQAQASAATAARTARVLAIAQKAAPGMIVVSLGNDLYGGYKVTGHKLFVKIMQVKNEKIVGTCEQNSLDNLIVLNARIAAAEQGVLSLAVQSPGTLNRITYTLRPNIRLCTAMVF